MRRNQTLRVLLPFLLVCAVATATASQLAGVSVSSQGSLTTVTIRVAGTFTHTEYRPSENMLMVDLAGVSATKLDGKLEAIASTGVQAYRVIGFRGTNGSDVSRVELTVSPTATVKFSEVEGGVQVRILGGKAPLPASQAVVDAPDDDIENAQAEANSAEKTETKLAQGAMTSPSASPNPVQAMTAVKPLAKPVQTPARVSAQPVQVADAEVMPSKARKISDTDAAEQTTEHQRAKAEQPVRVRDVSVTRGPQGTEVQISASGTVQPEAMRLENPDRLVIDLPNAMWSGSPRQVAVKNADMKSVRMALYQLNPPVTRVVLDLTEARDYELLPSSSGLRVRLRALTASSAPATETAPASAKPQPVAIKQQEPAAEPTAVVEAENVAVKPVPTTPAPPSTGAVAKVDALPALPKSSAKQ
ncbi:MAG: AMIN domain-containing protein, partial [Acidobacteriaceae bacterium]|nr:AMIN domain-containing protein [Acidobacteriaceae bacterium]